MSVREQIVDAAFDLFEERGFDATTVEDVVRRAGVGRTTFFRYFRAKEDAVLADHEQLLAQVEALLQNDGPRRAAPEDLAERVTVAARTVLLLYVDEGERARRRYRLSASAPAIRSREAASLRAYQSAFLRACHRSLDGQESPSLDAELIATGVITATHHVLRRWLREETSSPRDEFDAAIGRALSPWLPTVGRQDDASPQLRSLSRRATPLLEELLAHLQSLDPIS